MSTYYYLVCNTHKEYCDLAARTTGGYGHLGDSDETVIPFAITHGCGCDIQIISEHSEKLDDIDADKEWVEWTFENIDELYLGSR